MGKIPLLLNVFCILPVSSACFLAKRLVNCQFAEAFCVLRDISVLPEKSKNVFCGCHCFTKKFNYIYFCNICNILTHLSAVILQWCFCICHFMYWESWTILSPVCSRGKIWTQYFHFSSVLMFFSFLSITYYPDD